MITPIAPSVSISVGATSTRASIVMPTNGGLHLANCGAAYVTVFLTTGGTTAVLGTGLTIPANGQVLMSGNALQTTVDAIGSAAGNTLICTPALF